MKFTTTSTLCCAIAILGVSCASKSTPTSQPSASVTIGGYSAAYKGAVATAKGTLNYQGTIHHFTATGVGAGGYGAQKVSATGSVQNLNNLADFNGIFKGASKGLTVLNGKMQSKMTNENGVVVYLSGEREGVATNTGVRAFKVRLTD